MSWLELCRDYDSSQVDCSIALIGKFLAIGNIQRATHELHHMLQQRHSERLMLNTLRMLDCTLPHTALSLFITRFKSYSGQVERQGLTHASKDTFVSSNREELLYSVLLWQWLQKNECPERRYWDTPDAQHDVSRVLLALQLYESGDYSIGMYC